MPNWPPILGFSNCPTEVRWRDGTAIAGGILGDMSMEALARMKAEQERNEELRQQPNVVLLDDFR